MNATTTKNTDLSRQADELAASEILVETNAGTFGPRECQAAVGTGDTKYGEYTVWERVGDGRRRRAGCGPDRAPGNARYFTAELAEARTALRDLRGRAEQ